MNVEMAYLTGMILGNGEIQRGTRETTITIDIPYKNLYTDDLKDVSVYVKASTVDIRSIIEPLIGHDLTVTQSKHSTKMSFTKSNDEYVMRELMRLIGNGTHHSTMRMNPELFGITADEKKALLKGIADVTGYIRKSNIAFGQEGARQPVNYAGRVAECTADNVRKSSVLAQLHAKQAEPQKSLKRKSHDMEL